jgi:hypothetical protein
MHGEAGGPPKAISVGQGRGQTFAGAAVQDSENRLLLLQHLADQPIPLCHATVFDGGTH